MRRTNSLFMVPLSICILLSLTGCGGGPKFQVHTTYNVAGIYQDDGNVNTSAFCYPYCYSSTLYTEFEVAATNSHGFRTFDNAYLPAFWTVTRYPSTRCGVVVTKSANVGTDGTFPLPCSSQPFWSSSPTPIDATSPPTTVSFTGDAVLNSTYGMPTVDWYNENGDAIGSLTASSVATDGSSATVSTPGFLTNQYNGSYIAVLNNINSDSTHSAAAAAAVDLVGNAAPPAPVTINGYEQSMWACQDEGGCWTLYDSGNFSLTINGYTVDAYYGESSTAESIAADLAGSLNGQGFSATASQGVITVSATDGRPISATYSCTSSWPNPPQSPWHDVNFTCQFWAQ
jgi:hypothetical protein